MAFPLVSAERAECDTGGSRSEGAAGIDARKRPITKSRSCGVISSSSLIGR